MKKDTYFIAGDGNQKLYVRRYEGSKTTGKVVQILHGMAEFGDRYDGFCEYLTEHGYIVYVHDHRKHGMSISGSQKVGYYTTDTWKQMVKDIDFVQEDIMEKEDTDKVIMLGHSMGSFLLRTYLIDYGDHVEKAIIMGTAYTNVALSGAGTLAAKIIGRVAGHKPSPFLNQMSVGPYNKSFEPGKTGSDWLTRDEEICSWYEENPLCGFVYTPKFYEEITKGLLYIIRNENIKKTPNIPVLFVSGDQDPVGEMGKGVTKVFDIFKSLGYDAQLTLFEGARHEILNEFDKEEVYQCILEFLDK